MNVSALLLTIGLSIHGGADHANTPDRLKEIIPVDTEDDLPHEFSVKLDK
ncbi:hypothetical protein NQ095_19035 [Rossellomorea sp. SC111]|nr:hypothetical protein [Rossellomorea sp. SC111]MCR8850518.1 hypothetical protein [Rossellomorea sp. SC111]